MNDGKTTSVGVQPCHSACRSGAYTWSPSPGVLTSTMKAIVRPRNASRETRREVGAEVTGSDIVDEDASWHGSAVIMPVCGQAPVAAVAPVAPDLSVSHLARVDGLRWRDSPERARATRRVGRRPRRAGPGCRPRHTRVRLRAWHDAGTSSSRWRWNLQRDGHLRARARWPDS